MIGAMFSRDTFCFIKFIIFFFIFLFYYINKFFNFYIMNIEEKYNNFYFYYEYFVVFINGTSYNLNKSKKVLKFLNNLDSFSTIGGVSKLNNYEQIRLVQVLDLLSIK